jgi:glycosyltransferase involved in cell wall biosynthesis
MNRKSTARPFALRLAATFAEMQVRVNSQRVDQSPHRPPPHRRVAVAGQHEPDYPRNVFNQRLMRAAGYDVALAHSRGPWWQRSFSIVWQYLRAADRTDVVFVTEGAHRHMFWLKLAALVKHQRIVFDPFISLYNTEVEDRALHAACSAKAWLAKWRDFVSCHCADLLVFDTPEHRAYFTERYRLAKPSRILRVGVDEALFRPLPVPAREPSAPCDVLFYGTYIPLQGIDTILAAADRLRSDGSIQFTLVGRGQEYPRLRALADQLALPNLSFVEPLTVADLAARIARADLCLGVFSAGSKAGQVVPNKVVQCAAMAKPIITRRSASVERDFAHERSAYLIPAADPLALAEAVRTLSRDPALRARLGAGARAAFEGSYSLAAQTSVMRELLDTAAARQL